ncbi:Centromere/kinetochore protein zw10 involved in mitotic chromosome segregation [Ceraceosorus bombacis]|uniref:Centromere/kinetochore protein zw10 involved in mitotic chromosome segregation n=1 Tax=Ceraceosorus bombacis TaxID=401625 RepID=A0A0P1BGS3_9BASI|nr:Centromere/kinetochore protein zw10 involved in mitotic chromosome segregation [Ceraceosorus bombacis]
MQSTAQMSAGAGRATGTGTGTGTTPSPSSSDNTSLEAFLQSLVPPFTNSNSGTSPAALPYSAQVTLLESHVQRLRSDLARALSTLHSARQSIDSLRSLLSQGPLDVQAFVHTYTSASEEVSAMGNGEQEWLSKTTAARAIAKDWTELEAEFAQELRGACERFLSVREEDAWIVLCSKSARAHSTSNEPTPISNLFEIQAAISAEQARKTLERLAARLLDILRGLLHVSLLDESSDDNRSRWQATATPDSWSAHRSHEAETSFSTPQAIVSFLVWLRQADERAVGPIAQVFLRQIEIASLLGALRHSLPPSLRTESGKDTYAQARDVARTSLELHRALLDLLSDKSDTRARSRSLVEEMQPLLQFERDVSQQWARRLVERNLQSARIAALMDKEGWEGVPVEAHLQDLTATSHAKSEEGEVEAAVGLEGEQNGSERNVGEEQVDEDAWGWDGDADEERRGQETKGVAQRAKATPRARDVGTSISTSTTKKKTLGGVRVVRPSDQLGSGPLPQDSQAPLNVAQDQDAWGFDEDVDENGASGQAENAHAVSSTPFQPLEDADDAWFADEAPGSSSSRPAQDADNALASAHSDPSAMPSMDLEEEIDEEAWGLTDQEKEQVAARKRASMILPPVERAREQTEVPSPFQQDMTRKSDEHAGEEHAWGDLEAPSALRLSPRPRMSESFTAAAPPQSTASPTDNDAPEDEYEDAWGLSSEEQAVRAAKRASALFAQAPTQAQAARLAQVGTEPADAKVSQPADESSKDVNAGLTTGVDEDEEDEEDAWGLSTEEQAIRAAKRASMLSFGTGIPAQATDALSSESISRATQPAAALSPAPSVSAASEEALPGTPKLRAPSAPGLHEAAQATYSAPPAIPVQAEAPAVGGSAQPLTSSRALPSMSSPADIEADLSLSRTSTIGSVSSDAALPPSTPTRMRDEPLLDDRPSRVSTPIVPPAPALSTPSARLEDKDDDGFDAWEESLGVDKSADVQEEESKMHSQALSSSKGKEEIRAWEWNEEDAPAPDPDLISPPARAERIALPHAPKSVSASRGGPSRTALRSFAAASTPGGRSASPVPLTGAAPSPQLRQATLRNASNAGASRSVTPSGSARARPDSRSSNRSASPATSRPGAAELAQESTRPPIARPKMLISQRTRLLVTLAENILADAKELLKHAATHGEGAADGSDAKQADDASPDPQVLLNSIRDVFDLYRAVVPSAHEAALQISALAAQFLNDCSYLSRAALRLQEEWSSIAAASSKSAFAQTKLELASTAKATAMLGQHTFAAHVAMQISSLDALLDGADSFVGTSDAGRCAAVERSIRACVTELQNLNAAWKDVLLAPNRMSALGALVEHVLSRVLREVEDLEDISEKESERIAEAVKLLAPLEDLFVDPRSGTEQTAVALFVPSWFKCSYLCEILTGSLADIDFLYSEAAALVDYSPRELAKLVRALFADTPKRQKLLEKFVVAAPPT